MLTDLVQAIVTVTSAVSDGRIIPPVRSVAISSVTMLPTGLHPELMVRVMPSAVIQANIANPCRMMPTAT